MILVKCVGANGEPVFLNAKQIESFSADMTGKRTLVIFREGDGVIVDHPLKQFVKILMKAINEQP